MTCAWGKRLNLPWLLLSALSEGTLMRLCETVFLCTALAVGCSGSGTGRPPRRSFVTIAAPDGFTATGHVASIRIEGEDPRVFRFAVVSWPSRVPAAYTLSSRNLGVEAVEHTFELAADAAPGWYAVIASPTEPGLDVRVSSGLMLDDESWAIRFRTDSAPRVRLLSSTRDDGDQVFVDMEFSEALDLDVDSIRVSLNDSTCAVFGDPREMAFSMSLECTGSGSDLTVSIDEDVPARAGGVLHAREWHVAVGEVYRDPI